MAQTKEEIREAQLKSWQALRKEIDMRIGQSMLSAQELLAIAQALEIIDKNEHTGTFVASVA